VGKISGKIADFSHGGFFYLQRFTTHYRTLCALNGLARALTLGAEMRTVEVPLGERSYPIFIAEHILPELGRHCARLELSRRCAVISDSHVARRYGGIAINSLKGAGFDPVLVTVPSGESSKSPGMGERCYDRLARHRLERKSFIVALGGGVVGDLAGFVAATYLRGIPFVQAPTSLLAQVDSSVGGKVGVNLKAGKNLVGAFHQPRFVLCDLTTLATLSQREFRSGLAEVIKYGIIYDAALFARLERDLPLLLGRDTNILADVVARCCQIKAEVVQQDETETGLRAILNFGHTIGHAIEAISGYGKYLHGEAISIGQTAAAKLSVRACGLPVEDAARIERLFARAGLPTALPLSAARQRKLIEAMRLDKKVSAGEIRFVLARRIGTVEAGHKIAPAWISEALARAPRLP
jgi:3-dehydroquinate synthase